MKLWATHVTEDKLRMFDHSDLVRGGRPLPAQAFNEENVFHEESPFDGE